MGQGDDGRFDRSKQDVPGQRVSYPRVGGETSDLVHDADTCLLHGPEVCGRKPYNGILARQSGTADGLAPERLGFDDSAEFPVSEL